MSLLHAQSPVSQGVWLAGGSISLQGLHDDANDENEFALRFNPQVGYFIVNRLAVSANLRVQYGHREESGHSFGAGIGPGATYYFRPIGRQLYPYLAGQFMIFRSRFQPADDAGPSAVEIIERERSWQVGLGAALFAARNVAVTGELFLSRAHFHDTLEFPQPVEQRNSSWLYGVLVGIRAFIY